MRSLTSALESASALGGTGATASRDVNRPQAPRASPPSVLDNSHGQRLGYMDNDAEPLLQSQAPQSPAEAIGRRRGSIAASIAGTRRYMRNVTDTPVSSDGGGSGRGSGGSTGHHHHHHHPRNTRRVQLAGFNDQESHELRSRSGERPAAVRRLSYRDAAPAPMATVVTPPKVLSRGNALNTVSHASFDVGELVNHDSASSTAHRGSSRADGSSTGKQVVAPLNHTLGASIGSGTGSAPPQGAPGTGLLQSATAVGPDGAVLSRLPPLEDTSVHGSMSPTSAAGDN